MNHFLVGVGSGIVAAFVGFLLKEWITSAIRGFRIRTLLFAEIKESIRGLKDHYPTLDIIEKNIGTDSGAFIWDSSTFSQVPGHVSEAIYHFTPSETVNCWRFYDLLSRISDIRNEYNASVRSLIIEKEDGEPFKKIAIACVHDLQRNYREAILTGGRVLLEIAQRRWFVDIDVEEFRVDQNSAEFLR